MLYVFFSSVVISVIWALVRWGWIEFGLLPNVKNYVPSFAIPCILTILHLYICRHFIAAIHDRIEYLMWYVLGALAFVLFMSTGKVVERGATDICQLTSITADDKDVLSKADYIYVDKMALTDLDISRYSYYFDFSTFSKKSGADIDFHFYEVYPLRSVPTVFVCREVTERHDYTHAKKEELDEWYREFRQKELQEMVQRHQSMETRQSLNGRYMKRLLPSDNIEGYQKAISRIYNEEGAQMSTDNPIIYEITSDDIAQKDFSYYGGIWQIVLFVEGLLIVIVFSFFFIKKEYYEAVSSSEKLNLFSSLKSPQMIVLWSLPVLMVIVYLLMMLSGYSLDNSNHELLLKWGALNKSLVTENGEWWRLFTMAFVHAGFMHLFGNLMFFVLSAIELLKRYNGYQIAFVFIASTFMSSLFFMLYSDSSTGVGASGGVFGLMAFWVTDGLLSKFVDKDEEMPLAALRCPIGMIFLNIIMSFGNGISLSCHLGGLAGGSILGIAMCLMRDHKKQM